jgi:osmotically-inducible protein OsmY
MSKGMGKAALTASALALLLALGGCGDRVDTTAEGEHPSVEINRAGEEGAKRDSAEAPVAPQTGVMGASSDATLDPDTRIASEVQQALASDADLAGMKIDVSSEDGAVTLRGRAPDPGARERATALARNVREVKAVENQLTLG